LGSVEVGVDANDGYCCCGMTEDMAVVEDTVVLNSPVYIVVGMAAAAAAHRMTVTASYIECE